MNLIASLLKSDFFALFDDESNPLGIKKNQSEELSPESAETAVPVAVLNADQIENAIVYVGSDLDSEQWLARADVLIRLSSAKQDKPEFTTQDDSETDDDPETDEGDREPERKPNRVRFDFPPDVLRQSRAVVEYVANIILAIPTCGTAEKIADAFSRILEELHFKSGVNSAVRRAGLNEQALRQAALDLKVVQGLERAISAVIDASSMASDAEPETVADSVTISCSEFKTELELAMASQNIETSTKTEGGIQFLNVTDMRGLSFRAVFVLGLVEGEFPQRVRSDWLYPQTERDNFRHLGLALEDISANTSLSKEEHYFYQTVCRAREYLYLCRPEVIEGGASTIPSYFIHEVINCLGLDKRSFVQVNAGFNGENLLQATNTHELAISVVRAETRMASRLRQETGNRPLPDPEIIAALGQFARASHDDRPSIISDSAQRRIEIEKGRFGSLFDEYDGLIKNNRLQQLLDKKFRGHTFSASEFNDYGQCPFRYFFKRVLRITPAAEAAVDLQAVDQGIIAHDVLRYFFAEYRGQLLTHFSDDELIEKLRSAADIVFEKFEHSFPPLNRSLWAIEKQRILGELGLMLQDEIALQKTLSDVEVSPLYLELGFGIKRSNSDPDSTSEPLRLARVNGDQTDILAIRGQIDRVDRSQDGHLIAYDYKSSKGSSVKDIREGRDVQLGIYLLAIDKLFRNQDDEEIAGGGYYSLKSDTGRRNNGLYRSDMNQYMNIGSRCQSLMPSEAWQAIRGQIEKYIWHSYDGIRSGDFRLLPSQNNKTCEHCDYKSVCRFDRYRIQIKKQASADIQEGQAEHV